MKKILIIISFFLFGCKESKEEISNTPIKVYTWEEYEKVKSKSPKRAIIVVDTFCPFETKRAKIDIAKNKLVYFSYMYAGEILNEMNIVLKPYNMIAKDGKKSCIRPPEGFNYSCYENLMDAEVEKRFGRKWIDSIERTAIKNYVIKHPNEPFDENGKDLRDEFIKK